MQHENSILYLIFMFENIGSKGFSLESLEISIPKKFVKSIVKRIINNNLVVHFIFFIVNRLLINIDYRGSYIISNTFCKKIFGMFLLKKQETETQHYTLLNASAIIFSVIVIPQHGTTLTQYLAISQRYIRQASWDSKNTIQISIDLSFRYV